MLKTAQNKLMKNGFLPEAQTERYEQWIDVRNDGTPISFSIKPGLTGLEVHGAYKVHGRKPDRPEVDEFNSDYTHNLSEAIRFSRLKAGG